MAEMNKEIIVAGFWKFLIANFIETFAVICDTLKAEKKVSSFCALNFLMIFSLSCDFLAFHRLLIKVVRSAEGLH